MHPIEWYGVSFVRLKWDLCSGIIIALLYIMLPYIGPHYNGSWPEMDSMEVPITSWYYTLMKSQILVIINEIIVIVHVMTLKMQMFALKETVLKFLTYCHFGHHQTQ